MEAKLIVVGGKAQAEEFELKLPTIVGRSRSADIPLNHPLVSRQHCELFESEGHLMVRDLGSLNGTFIGDSRVTAEALLTPGGHLTIGSVTFEAVYEAEGGEADEAPDFAMEDSVPIDQTVQDPRAGRAGKTAVEESPANAHAEEPAHADEPAGGESSGEGFDMSWLDDSAEEASAPGPASASEATIQHVEKPAPAAARGVQAAAAKKADKSKAEPPALKTKTAAPAAEPASEDVPTEFAPAEERPKPEGDDADMDDFFRSLTS